MREKVLETLLALALALLVIYWFTKAPWILLAAITLGFIALIIPALANAIYKGWTIVTGAIGLVMNKVLLTIVFVLFLIPLAFISKLFGRKSLKARPAGNSYFKSRNYTYTKESIINVW